MPLPADTALPWMAYVDALVGCSNKEWIRLRAADLRVYIASWENISRSEPSETLVQLTHVGSTKSPPRDNVRGVYKDPGKYRIMSDTCPPENIDSLHAQPNISSEIFTFSLMKYFKYIPNFFVFVIWIKIW